MVAYVARVSSYISFPPLSTFFRRKTEFWCKANDRERSHYTIIKMPFRLSRFFISLDLLQTFVLFGGGKPPGERKAKEIKTVLLRRKRPA